MNEQMNPTLKAQDHGHEPDHVIEVETSLVDRVLHTLKHGDNFMILDRSGDIGGTPQAPEGLFYRDTRYLSAFELLIEGKRPLLLSSVIQDDNASLSIDMTNPDLRHGKPDCIPRDQIAIERTKLLWNKCCHERIGLQNYADKRHAFKVALRFSADFRDLFEARGEHRVARGKSKTRVLDASRIEIHYQGLDTIDRYTTLTFDPAPARLDEWQAIFDLSLEAGAKSSIKVAISCSEGKPADQSATFNRAYLYARREVRQIYKSAATVESSNSLFNEIARRSIADIYMLATPTPHGGLYPYAGIPWFSTIFGRDGIITAMMMLWSDPTLAQGVLLYLAHNQAKDIRPQADAQPGKILHEQRFGEMANLGEVPFAHYYGTIDATPLFVMLAGLYYRRTGDVETIKAIWPNIQAAIAWCDDYGDRDKDGFIEYFRETESGLANQGWKDSQDSIFHADGTAAPGSIALCEVQGYVYAAKRAAADLADILGEKDKAQNWRQQAEHLREAFHKAFWCEELGTYALALDGDKKPCKVRSSNAGHALFTGIATPEAALRVAADLMSPDHFSGWGIRTIAQTEARYNPMSYHNGSIWPHDNALIAMGLANYGLKEQAARVFGAMFDAAVYQDLRRLPELFCGFFRRPRRGPTSYPVACAPQAWAAATPMALLAACLGLDIDHAKKEVRFTQPVLPSFLDQLTLRNLRVGAESLDLEIARHGSDVTIAAPGQKGDVRVVSIK